MKDTGKVASVRPTLRNYFFEAITLCDSSNCDRILTFLGFGVRFTKNLKPHLWIFEASHGGQNYESNSLIMVVHDTLKE